MKKYTPILFACFCLGACHTSSTNVKPTIDRTLNMVQERSGRATTTTLPITAPAVVIRA